MESIIKMFEGLNEQLREYLSKLEVIDGEQYGPLENALTKQN